VIVPTPRSDTAPPAPAARHPPRRHPGRLPGGPGHPGLGRRRPAGLGGGQPGPRPPGAAARQPGRLRRRAVGDARRRPGSGAGSSSTPASPPTAPSPAPRATGRRTASPSRPPLHRRARPAGGAQGAPILNAAWPIYAGLVLGRPRRQPGRAGQGPLATPSRWHAARRGGGTVAARPGYRRPSPRLRRRAVDIDRIAEALPPTEATRLSGNSRADGSTPATRPPSPRRSGRGRGALLGKAACNKCHLGPSLHRRALPQPGRGWRPPAAGAPRPAASPTRGGPP